MDQSVDERMNQSSEEIEVKGVKKDGKKKCLSQINLKFREESKENGRRQMSPEQAKTSVSPQRNPILATYNENAIPQTGKSERQKKYLKHYEKAIELLAKHLKDDRHPLGFLMTKFVKSFIREYGVSLRESPLETRDKAFASIKHFIRIMQESVSAFYNFNAIKTDPKSIYFFTAENLHNFLASIIFKKEFHDLLLSAQRAMDQEKEFRLAKKFEQIKVLEPQDFQIPAKFCLNNKTLEHFNQKTQDAEIDANSYEDSGQNKKLGESLNMMFADSVCTDKKSFVNPDQDPVYLPFQKCIDYVKLLETTYNPFNKLHIYMRVSDLALGCISLFYKEHSQKFVISQITSEEIFSIMMFITAKSRIPSLYSHFALIDYFYPEKFKNGITGYYLAILESSISYIEKMQFDKELKPHPKSP